MSWDSKIVRLQLSKRTQLDFFAQRLLPGRIGWRNAKKQNFFASGAPNAGNIEWRFAIFVLAYRLL
jgi:hypothetical protein